MVAYALSSQNVLAGDVIPKLQRKLHEAN